MNPRIQRLLQKLVLVHEAEFKPMLLATGYFFMIMTSYYLIRPMREALALAKGADKLPWLMTGTLLVMLMVNPLFAALVSHFPRRRFIPITYRFFLLSLVAFYFAFRLPSHGGPMVGYAFYLWISVFNLFVVSVFWALMTDLFKEDQGRRLFGFIAVGGTLGAIFGSSLADGLSRILAAYHAHPANLLLLSVVLLEGAVQCSKGLARHFKLGDVAGGVREPGAGLFEGLTLIARSPYLMLIGFYIVLMAVTSTFLYLEQGRIVAQTFHSQAARTAAFARMDLWVNILTLLAQVFLTGRIIRTFGVQVAICILPVITLAGFGALSLWPFFSTLVIFQVLRRGLHYAVDRPVRELLYIPLGPGERYKSKPFIDTFGYRGGDMIGAWSPAALASLGAFPAGVAAVGVSALWMLVSAWLGRMNGKLDQVSIAVDGEAAS